METAVIVVLTNTSNVRKIQGSVMHHLCHGLKKITQLNIKIRFFVFTLQIVLLLTPGLYVK